MTTIGERLRMARDKSGLKQTEVKERTNINNKTLSGYENNVSQPDPETLVVLADLYEVRYEWLFAGKGEMTANQTLGKVSNWDSKLPELTAKDEKDITADLEKMISDLDSQSGYAAFDGRTYDDLSEDEKEDRELLLSSLENSLRLAKRIAKQKFTPKKYRD